MPFDSKFIQSLLDDLESDRSERPHMVNMDETENGDRKGEWQIPKSLTQK